MYRKPFIEIYTQNGFDFNEAKSEVDFAMDILFNYTYKDFMLSKEPEDWQKEKLIKIIKERVKTRRPIQQLTGQAYFYGRKFFVNEYTLIPRPETELVIKNLLDISQNSENTKILDIGSGTGCISITLALENKNTIVDSVDISPEAIEIAKKNAIYHDVFDRVNFYQSDLFENVKGKYNIIVSNPPYIPLKDKVTLQEEVRNYDPALALFTQDDKGLEFYEKIISQASDSLVYNGYIVFETGINQSESIKEIFEKNGYFIIKNEKDYNSIPRVIIAQKV